jgi:hypothetical protein
MAEVNPAFVITGNPTPNQHSSETFRQMLQGVMGSEFSTSAFAGGVASYAGGGGHGVVGSSALAVTQKDTPDMGVKVAAGLAYVRGTESADQGVYSVCNDAATNLTISTADGSNPRRDLIVAKIEDDDYSGSAQAWSLAVVTGTPAGSPADPTPPANSLVLARVAVAAGASSITNANITDLRPRAAALGGTVVCTSSTRPTGAALYEGLTIFETDTDRLLVYDGANWQRVAWTASGGRTGCSISRAANQSIGTGAGTAISFDTQTTDTDDFFAPTSTTVTIPSGLGGLYAVFFSVAWGASPGTTPQIGLGGTFGSRYMHSPPSGISNAATISTVRQYAAGDTIQGLVYQNSGGNVNATAVMQVWRLAI